MRHYNKDIFKNKSIKIGKLINNFRIARFNHKYGFINNKKLFITDMIYDEVTPFINFRSFVRIKDKWWVIDASGNEICDIKYDKISKFKYNTFAITEINNLFGVIDKSGNEILPNKYSVIKIYNYNTIFFYDKYNKIGCYHNNKVLCEPKYDKIYEIGGVNFEVENNEKKGILDNNGKLIINIQYKKISNIFIDYVLYYMVYDFEDNVALFSKDGKLILNFDIYDPNIFIVDFFKIKLEKLLYLQNRKSKIESLI
jgi:hypothetical protein